MSATTWGAVVDALVTTMDARSGYRSAWDSTQAGGTILLLDSVEVGLIGDRSGTFLVIAFPGDPDVSAEAGRSGQVVATLGTARRREEEGLVRCLAVDQRGDIGSGIASASRTAALGVVDDVDAELRASPSLGLVPTYAHVQARIGSLPSIRTFLSAGVVTWVEFEVIYSARI